MPGALLVVALSGLALGGVLGARRAWFTFGLRMQAAAATGVAVAGFWMLATRGSVGEGFTREFAPRLGVDGLSGLFLGTLVLIAAPALVFSLRSALLELIDAPAGRRDTQRPTW